MIGFQNVSTDVFAIILSNARKYRLDLVTAHQFMGQLNPLLIDAVIGNVGAIMAFRVGAKDTEVLYRELGTDAQALRGHPALPRLAEAHERPPAEDLATGPAHR